MFCPICRTAIDRPGTCERCEEYREAAEAWADTLDHFRQCQEEFEALPYEHQRDIRQTVNYPR